MVDQLFEALVLIPSVLVQAYAFGRLLAIRRKGVLWAWFLAVSLTFGFVRSTLDPVTRMAASLVVTVALYVPCVLLSTLKPLAARVVVVLATVGCSALAEAATSLLLVCFAGDLAGPEAFGSSHPLVMGLRVVHVALLASLFWLLGQFMRRYSQDLPNRNPWLFVGFPATQAAMLVLLVYLGQFAGLEQRDDDLAFAFYAGFVVLCVVCAVVDVAYAYVFEESVKARAERVRLDVLQSAIDEELSRGAHVEREIRQTARLRHDLANQLAVVRDLAQRGDVASAKEHVREMRRILDRDGEGR